MKLSKLKEEKPNMYRNMYRISDLKNTTQLHMNLNEIIFLINESY